MSETKMVRTDQVQNYRWREAQAFYPKGGRRPPSPAGSQRRGVQESESRTIVGAARTQKSRDMARKPEPMPGNGRSCVGATSYQSDAGPNQRTAVYTPICTGRLSNGKYG